VQPGLQLNADDGVSGHFHRRSEAL
jgi:hypothetical protein